jgi:hypothetical protein
MQERSLVPKETASLARMTKEWQMTSGEWLEQFRVSGVAGVAQLTVEDH